MPDELFDQDELKRCDTAVTRVEVYAHLARESTRERGATAGISGEALDFLTYFDEVTLVLSVEHSTGIVLKVEVIQ